MRITNNGNLPDAIVRAVENDPYPQQYTGDISATRLIDSPRIRVLTRRHWDELEEDAVDRIWSLMGQVAHGILERAETVAITEERLFAEAEGWKVSGQFDRLALLPDGTLQDYKVTSVWGVIHGCKPEWERQLNVLRWLALRNGYEVDRLEIVAILRDWSRGRAMQGGNYPARQVAVVDVPVWPFQDAERYVAERVRLHQQAERGPLPECTPEERWERPTSYAVMRKGRKSAIRIYEDPGEAEDRAAAEGGYVEVRPGRCTRCEEYCAVAPFCDQQNPTGQTH